MKSSMTTNAAGLLAMSLVALGFYMFGAVELRPFFSVFFTIAFTLGAVCAVAALRRS